MPMKNLTGVPDIFGGDLAAQNQEQLSEEEKLKRKKALFAGARGPATGPYGFLFGQPMSGLGTPMV